MPRRGFLAAMSAAAAAPALAQVQVGEASRLRSLVPADQLEMAATQEYGKLLAQARQQGALAPESHPQLQALRAISSRLIAQSARWNERAGKWRWEVNLIGSKQVNAFCMPGGKIAVFTGLLNGLRLTEDETAMVVGHEMAHALREHAREQAAKNTLTGLAANVLGMVFSGSNYSDVANIAINAGHGLAARAFSRSDEREADLVGMELAARGGFDPQAGITLWEKMGRASKGAPPEFLSTHPANASRIEDIRRHLPDVMPLYLRAKP